MYDPQGYYVPNAINRYNLAAWMPLKYNADGSLDMYIQASLAGRGQGSQLAARARERAVQPHGAHLLADGSGARRHLQAAAGEEGAVSVHESK